MTDFEKMVTKLRESPYREGKHFEVWEWEAAASRLISDLQVSVMNGLASSMIKTEI